jgi:hypothetical protein
MAGLNPRFGKIKLVIFLLLLFSCFGGIVWFFVWGDVSYLNNLEKRSESDFIVREYQVEKVFERTYRKNNKPIYSYLYFKLYGEKFNLSTVDNFVNGHARSQEQKNELLNKIKVGDTVKVKIYKPELLETEKNNPIMWLKRFIMVDNREVQIYRLEKNDKVIIPDIDITKSFKLGRQGSNLSATRLFLVIIFGGLLIVIISTIIHRLRNRNNL